MSWSTASGNYNFITTTTAGATASGIFNSDRELVQHRCGAHRMRHQQLRALRQGRRRMDECELRPLGHTVRRRGGMDVLSGSVGHGRI
jgi:hypothetical protein